MSGRSRLLLGGCLLLGAGWLGGMVGLLLWPDSGQALAGYLRSRLRGLYSVEDRLAMHGQAVALRVGPAFAAAGVSYPPRELTLLAFKDSRLLEVHARNTSAEPWRWVCTYPILGMSGALGPKLREGDRQVPEGLYDALFLNANSRYHLAIRLDYPNAFDRQMGQADGRARLGSDIMIHGTRASAGCLAMGNQVAEDLFILAAVAGREQVRVVISPTDFRDPAAVAPTTGLPWTATLYATLSETLADFSGAVPSR